MQEIISHPKDFLSLNFSSQISGRDFQIFAFTSHTFSLEKFIIMQTWDDLLDNIKTPLRDVKA